LWNASDIEINASGLKKYKIYYYDADNVSGSYVIDKKEEIKEFMNKTFYGSPGHTYCFWVEAYDRAENYRVSNTKCATMAKAADIFDAVEMLEYLSGEKNLSVNKEYYDRDNNKAVNLYDVFTLIENIVIN